MNNQFFSMKTILLLFLTLGLTHCSMKTVHSEPAATEKSAEAPSAPATPIVEAPQVGLLAVAPAPEVAPPEVPAPSVHSKVKVGVEAAKALGWLKNGNTRYLKGFVRKDGQAKKDIEKLASGQTPHTIVLSCSDSRVPPEIVFDQKLGEIFVVRTAGEALDNSSIASIEYAVEHLGSQLLVVMGHSSCGAVKAALATMDGSDAGSPALNALVQDIHPRITSFKGQTPSPGVENESWANTRGVAQDLLGRSKIIREKTEAGQLVIKTALYHLDHGNVDFDP